MASNCGQPCWPPPLLLLLAVVRTCPYSHAFVTGVWTDIENRSSITTGDFLLNATALAELPASLPAANLKVSVMVGSVALVPKYRRFAVAPEHYGLESLRETRHELLW